VVVIVVTDPVPVVVVVVASPAAVSVVVVVVAVPLVPSGTVSVLVVVTVVMIVAPDVVSGDCMVASLTSNALSMRDIPLNIGVPRHKCVLGSATKMPCGNSCNRSCITVEWL
jgi:hypothetical protein